MTVPSVRTLLLVEDHLASRVAMRELLVDRSFRVLDAGTLGQAHAVFCEEPDKIDALVTDMTLPDGLGSHLAAELQRARPDLPVVILSGRDADDPEVSRALRAQRTVFARKPIHIDELESVISHLLESK
ncbi:MAG TPA: response regulator [Polyangiaceae bacterium]|nr:response regulator [Polyangiaceae bacterium]